MAAIAASGEMDLLRGTPCWSTTTRRTVRRPISLIRAATSVVAAACSSLSRPCRATKPGTPTPALSGRSSGIVVLTSKPSNRVCDHLGRSPGSVLFPQLIQQPGGEVVWLHVGQGQEGLGALHPWDLEDPGEQQVPQMGVVADAQPDQQVECAGH